MMGDLPRIIVARPRAVPIPRPLMAFGPTRLNLFKGYGKFESVRVKAGSRIEPIRTWVHFVTYLEQ